jgi:hypothetical protein
MKVTFDIDLECYEDDFGMFKDAVRESIEKEVSKELKKNKLWKKYVAKRVAEVLQGDK